jgi:hypothetical protein
MCTCVSVHELKTSKGGATMQRLFLAFAAIVLVNTFSLAQGYEQGKAYLGAAFTYGIGPGYILGGEGSRFKHVGIAWDVYVSSFTAETNAPSHPDYKYDLLGFMGSGVYHFTSKEAFDPFAKVGIG